MMIPIGHENFIACDFVVSVLRPDSSPAKRLRKSAEESGMLINATNGRKARSIIILQNNQVIISILHPEKIKSRFEGRFYENSKNDGILRGKNNE